MQERGKNSSNTIKFGTESIRHRFFLFSKISRTIQTGCRKTKTNGNVTRKKKQKTRIDHSEVVHQQRKQTHTDKYIDREIMCCAYKHYHSIHTQMNI
jgi:hypothetical protein